MKGDISSNLRKLKIKPLSTLDLSQVAKAN